MEYPCTRAMVSNVTAINPDNTVEEALAIFKEKNIRNVPVVDAEGIFVGLFGLHQVLIELLPKSVTMEHGLEDLGFVIDAAPGIAKKLKKLHDVKVSEFMNKDAYVVHEDTPTIEALRSIAVKGSPAVVTNKETGKFVGTISRKTLLDNLYEILEEIEKTK